MEDGQPVVIPTIHARIRDTLYLHGAVASRLLKHARERMAHGGLYAELYELQARAYR